MKEELENKIEDYLHEISGNYVLSGINYLAKAVIYYPYCDFKVTEIYTLVANDTKKTPSQVERCIRHFTHKNVHFIDRLFPASNGNAIAYLFTIFKKEIYDYWFRKEVEE